MGGDGGSLLTRTDIVKRSQSSSKKTCFALKNADNFIYCFICKDRLALPVVVCKRGQLYDKECIIKYLLNRCNYLKLSRYLNHIKSLKDIRDLQAVTENDTKSLYPFSSAISAQELNEKTKAFVNWKCGCLCIANAELQQIEGKKCLFCEKEITEAVELYASIATDDSLEADEQPASKKRVNNCAVEDRHPTQSEKTPRSDAIRDLYARGSKATKPKQDLIIQSLIRSETKKSP